MTTTCKCGSDSRVTQTRVSGATLRRRRECLSCQERWSTYEVSIPDHARYGLVAKDMRQAMNTALSLLEALEASRVFGK